MWRSVLPLLVALLLPQLARGVQTQRIVINAGTLLDGKGGTLHDVTIVLEGSKILSVGSEAAEGVTYDLGDLTVMPGWIDTHVHIGTYMEPNDRFHGLTSEIDETPSRYVLYGATNAYAHLMAGFTTVQSLGALPDRTLLDRELRDWIAEGNPGPRLLLTIGMARKSTGSPEEIREFVRNAVSEGADVVKLFATASIRDGGKQTMTDEQIQAALPRGQGFRKTFGRSRPRGGRRSGRGAGGLHDDRARKRPHRRRPRPDGGARHVLRPSVSSPRLLPHESAEVRWH